MRHHVSDNGLIIKKTPIAGDHHLVTIFSQEMGKIIVGAYGIKKITSKRLSHLEIGNYIRFSYSRNNDRFSLSETELVYAYSKIRRSEEKLSVLFTLFFILNKILPEHQNESIVFAQTLGFLQKLNNKEDVIESDFENFLSQMLTTTGFISDKHTNNALFDPYEFIEQLIGHKLAPLALFR